MTGPENYARAENLVTRSEGQEPDHAALTLAKAQVCATLALAAATALHSDVAGSRGAEVGEDYMNWVEVAT